MILLTQNLSNTFHLQNLFLIQKFFKRDESDSVMVNRMLLWTKVKLVIFDPRFNPASY